MANTTSKSGTSMMDDATSGTSSMEEDIRLLKADVARLSNDLGALGSSTLHRAQRAARDGAEQLKDAASDRVEQVRDSAEEMRDNLIECVRERPLASLAMAAAAGYILAMLRR